MGLSVSNEHDFALSVSADHQVVKYHLNVRLVLRISCIRLSYQRPNYLLVPDCSFLQKHPNQLYMRRSRSSSSATLASESTRPDACVLSAGGTDRTSASHIDIHHLDDCLITLSFPFAQCPAFLDQVVQTSWDPPVPPGHVPYPCVRQRHHVGYTGINFSRRKGRRRR